MNRIVSLGLVAVVASFAFGAVACSGASGGGGGLSADGQDAGQQDTGSPSAQDSGSPVQHSCTTVECGGTCCAAGQTCQSGQCANPAPACPVSFSNSTCESCFKTNCASSCGACAGDTECEAALTCYANCTTSACVSSCLSGLSTTTSNLLEALLGDPSGCVYESCRSECTTPAANGDPCIVGADCTSGVCAGDGVHQGWCTVQNCSSNPQCGIDSAGGLVWCGEVSGGSYACFPGCSSNADCSAFYCSSTGAAATCGADRSINGNNGNVCACW